MAVADPVSIDAIIDRLWDNLARRQAWEEAFFHYEELDLPTEGDGSSQCLKRLLRVF